LRNQATLPALLSILLAHFPPSPAVAAEELPPRAVARLGSRCFYHGPGIHSAVLSPDGSRVASAASYPSYFRLVTEQDRSAYDPVVVVWDAATGERVRELRVEGAAGQLAFAPDGKRLAAACGGGLVVFDVETGQRLRQFGSFEGAITRLEFSADGKRLRVAEWRGAVSVWDAADGKRLWARDCPPTVQAEDDKLGEMVTEGTLSPDGGLLVWSVSQFRPWKDDGLPPTFHVNGFRVHDADTGKLLYEKRFGEHDRMCGLAFSADGKRLVGGCDKLTTWEAATGKELSAVEVPASEVGLAPGGRRAVAVEGNSRVRLWDLETGKPVQDVYPGFLYVASDTLASAQAFSADGKTLLLATDSTLRLFDVTTGKERAVAGHRGAATPRFSADGRTLLTSCRERKCRWDVTPGKGPALSKEETRNAWEGSCASGVLAHDDSERLFLDDVDSVVCVREAATGKVLRQLEGSHLAYFGLFAPDGTRALLRRRGGSGPDVARLYDVATGKMSGEIQPRDLVGYPVFSPNGRVVAWADRAGAAHLYDAATGKPVGTLSSSRPLPRAEVDNADLFFSPDGEFLFAATYLHEQFSKPEETDKWDTLPTRVFHVASGREVGRFYANPEKASRAGRVSCAACSPDNRLLAVAEEESGTIRLIEIATGRVRVELTGHRHGVHGLTFAPDGRTLASGGEDNVVFLWDVIGTGSPAAADRPGEQDLLGWWADLAAGDAERAGVAIASLVRTPGQSVAFLRDRVSPAEPVDDRRLARLLADLDADAFEAREAASRELAELGERAEAALRKAAKEGQPEGRRRSEALLDRLERGELPPETVRAVRVIETLERLGTPETVRFLEALAKGVPEARQTRDAKAALDRLAKRR
jgi:WD40 repeat protein